MRTVKTGVTLDRDTLGRLDILMDMLGYKSRSRVINEAIEIFISERSTLFREGSVVGLIILIYDHHRIGVEHILTEVQHDFLDVIVGSLHIHIDRDNCMEMVVVRGDMKVIKSLIGRLEATKGLRLLKHLFFDVRPPNFV
jgi:CopG family nickel-responsive transcriptional regulator